MKLFLVMALVFLLGTVLPVNAADMEEIRAIRIEVGSSVLIAPIPDSNCPHVYIVKMEDGSIWAYSSSRTPGRQTIIEKALLFQGK